MKINFEYLYKDIYDDALKDSYFKANLPSDADIINELY